MEVVKTMRLFRQMLIRKWFLSTLILCNIILSIFLLYSLFVRQQCQTESTKLISNNKRITNNIKSIQAFLFIIIITSPKGIQRRNSIRETWLTSNVNDFKIEWRFVIGTKNLDKLLLKELEKEQSLYKDLLFLNSHMDSYYALTEKLLKSLIWTSLNVDSNYVMKVDDDSYVRLDILTNDLGKRKSLKRIYWGYFRGDSNVKRTGDWAENSWILSDHYLPYALGGGYILTFDLVDHISHVSDMLQIYNSEDVSLGVWLAPVKLNRIHDIRFDTEYKSRGCSNRHIVSHKQSPEEIYKKQNLLKNKNVLCEKESEIMMTFDYNWNTQPSKCCKRVPFDQLKTQSNDLYNKISI